MAESKGSATNHGIGFVPLSKEEGDKLRSGESGYGYIVDESGKFCLELPGGRKAEKNQKLRLNKCSNTGNRKQIWKFEGYNADADAYTGTLRSKADEDLCVEVRRRVQNGAKLRINRCKSKRKSNQQWTSDGDFLKLVEIRDLCAYHRGGTHENGAKRKKIVLKDCDDAPKDFADG